MEEGFVVKGGIKLPIGFRFCPTDQELLLHYLKKKAFAQQLPASVISDCDVFQTEPWLLPGGDLREKRYFFTNCGKVNKRSVGSGCWKCVGKEKEIRVCESNEVIGMKKTLMFFKGSHETRTRWVMHELRLVPYPYQMAIVDFAVYIIFQKTKTTTKASHKRAYCSNKLQRVHDVNASIMDFKVEFGHHDIGLLPPSSSYLSDDCSESS